MKWLTSYRHKLYVSSSWSVKFILFYGNSTHRIKYAHKFMISIKYVHILVLSIKYVHISYI
jgi:hypothetical protein